jgi:hypothetical protein
MRFARLCRSHNGGFRYAFIRRGGRCFPARRAVVRSDVRRTDPQIPGDLLPPEVLASISAYYRRVTTEAYPINRLVALVMVLTLAAICAEIVQGVDPRWIGWVSIALAGSGFVLTITRTVPNAVRLGSARDTAEQQSTLARAIYRDHLSSFARMIVVLGLQLTAR